MTSTYGATLLGLIFLFGSSTAAKGESVCKAGERWTLANFRKGCRVWYYECDDGLLNIRKCPRGSSFNPELGACSEGYVGRCDELPECREGEKWTKPDPKDCSKKYYSCDDGDLGEFFCKKGQEFSLKKGKCIKGYTSLCKSSPTEPMELCAGLLKGRPEVKWFKVDFLKVNPSRCHNSYYTCERGDYKAVTCLPGYELYPPRGKCVYGHRSKCNQSYQSETWIKGGGVSKKPSPSQEVKDSSEEPQTASEEDDLEGESDEECEDPPCTDDSGDDVDSDASEVSDSEAEPDNIVEAGVSGPGGESCCEDSSPERDLEFSSADSESFEVVNHGIRLTTTPSASSHDSSEGDSDEPSSLGSESYEVDSRGRRVTRRTTLSSEESIEQRGSFLSNRWRRSLSSEGVKSAADRSQKVPFAVYPGSGYY